MTTLRKASEAQALENYRVALENVEIQPEIAAQMADFGYDAEKIAEGKALLTNTRQKFDFNKQETQETVVARAAFEEKLAALNGVYKPHRKKAKVVFRYDDTILKNLALSGAMPLAYIQRMETIKTFYNGLQADSALLNRLLIFKVTPEDVAAALVLITETEAARSAYLIEVGESQDATKIKDAAFANIDLWMRDFYAVAKIALEDHPQLLEAVSLFVRS